MLLVCGICRYRLPTYDLLNRGGNTALEGTCRLPTTGILSEMAVSDVRTLPEKLTFVTPICARQQKAPAVMASLTRSIKGTYIYSSNPMLLCGQWMACPRP